MYDFIVKRTLYYTSHFTFQIILSCGFRITHLEGRRILSLLDSVIIVATVILNFVTFTSILSEYLYHDHNIFLTNTY